MKRYGIFVFYNDKGNVELYVEILLRSLLGILDELLVVINGNIQEREYAKLYQYSKKIIRRSNVGYDGGAYRDIFLFEDIKLEQWDEIILLNDTFYGPFFPWDTVFNAMDNKMCDFWGLTCHLGGLSGLFEEKIISKHLQSYFIVLKRNVFLHPNFKTFWMELQYPQNFKEAVMNFEIHFSEYLMRLGFHYESWLNVQIGDKLCDLEDLEELLTKWHFPILKRKKCGLQNYINLKKVFQYIVKNTDYPIAAIKEDIRRRCKNGKMKPYNPEQILKFCAQYENIYLFGKGLYARNIEQFVRDNGKKIAGYIVSKPVENDENTLQLDQFKIEAEDGVIVALSQKNFIEVYHKISDRIPSAQLIVPRYDDF